MERSAFGSDGFARYNGPGRTSSTIFNVQKPIFSVRLNTLDRSKNQYSYDSIRRLNVRAKHKGEGKKFDAVNF